MTLGYSFCPNDTFIFHALTHGLVEGVNVKECLEDVETLNQWARSAQLELTKVSYHACFHVLDKYVALRSGGALGRGVGPLLVSKPGRPLRRVLTPGSWTTAHLLLRLARPELTQLDCCRYDQVIARLLEDRADAGVIIHESRFTYERYGLTARLDLGQWWEQETGLPLPLGAILARRDLGEFKIRQLQQAVRRSLELAYAQPEASRSYIRQHACELSDEVVDQHIQTYVNEMSLDLGHQGEKAVLELQARAVNSGLVPASALPVFLPTSVPGEGGSN